MARGEDVEVVALGTRDSSGTPMGRDALFRGASITKPVTAALTMVLAEDGRIDLDAPVADLLPELAEPRVLRTLESPLDDTVACERPITARHLLAGTGGHGFCTWESAVTPLLMERLRQAADDIHYDDAIWQAENYDKAAHLRTSLIVEPRDGKIPALTPQGQARLVQQRATQRATPTSESQKRCSSTRSKRRT